MKALKKAVALMLCFVMTIGIFAVAGITVDDLAGLFKAEAAITLSDGSWSITQQRVVSDYESLYRSYQKRFFLGEETNWPTNFVIPGLGSADDYTPQGMTYWKAKEWILISAYDASGSGKHSVIYALDVVSTDLVAVFKIQNADGTTNTSHGGGIAASEYNFYYADDASKISYIPLSEMDVAPNTVKTIKLRDSIDLAGEMTAETTVKTSYCCYDEGVLWTGNFYLEKNTSYGNGFLPSIGYPSILFGYKLAGNSSSEEWYYLKNGYNLVKLTQGDGSQQTAGTITYNTYTTDGANAEIRGNVTTDTALGEATVNGFATANLTEGVTYKIEFIANNNLSDMYMFSPAGTHCNVKQSQQSTITNLGDGRYHYQMIFTAGLKPAGADSSWPATQSTDGSYTGTYTMRFDQDSVPAGGRSFAITDFSISEYVEPQGFTPDSKYEGIGCEGNPTYVVGLNTDRVQYAMVDKGKLYISRSWDRNSGTNHVRELAVGDIDLGIPGESNADINGRNRTVHLFDYDSATKFNNDQMLYMGEALCVINDYLYMFGEGAAWNYKSKDESNVCPEPIDVIWKIDQYAIQGLTRTHEDVTAVEYEKVNSLSEINNVDEYIVLHESPIKDPITQDNILYLLDSFGGYGDKKLPKKAAAANVDSALTGDSIGVVGYEIRDYSVKEENGKTSLILSAEDDANKSLHWQFESGNSTSLKLYNRDLYYAKHPYLYSGDTLFALTTTADGNMKIEDLGNGNFKISGGGGTYPIWCNDGSVQDSIDAYSYLYANHGYAQYTQNYHNLEEVAGTFHTQNASNIAQGTDEQMVFHIYKRVSDPYTSSYETQVYTDLKAKLTSDGTYDITLETYATNALQYQRTEERPTDFIFVLDSTGSMLDDKDCSGYRRYGASNTLSAYSVAGNSTSVGNTDATTGSTGNIYYMANDGEYYQLYVDSSSRGDDGSWISHKYYKYYWLYYKKDGVNVYYNPSTNGWQTTKPSESEVGKSYGNSDSARADCTIYTGVHYEKLNSLNRLEAVQNTVESLTYKIAAEANASGLDHRIAICSFGTDGSTTYGYQWTGTNMYTNDGTEISYPNITQANYKNAFFSVSQFDTLRNTLYDKMEPLGHSYPSYGLDMASKIIDNSDYEYDVNGTRSAVVIVISDGVPGWEEDANRNLTVTINTANDTLANGAYSLKRNGAYVYSVLLGNDSHFNESDFSTTDFMKYLSSEYTGSKSMSDPGPHNNKEGVNYYLQVPSGSSFSLDSIIDQIYGEVVANSNNAISSLTAEAILREHLTDAFDTSGASIKYETAKSCYDGIGRLYFEDAVTASGINGNLTDTNEIEITGFDYSANNVSEYNSNLGNGKKLIVTISGVIANADAELLNTSINDISKTAIYENSTYKNSNQPVKRFPTYHFTIPEYTYIMDYDLPMLDTDINGTLCSVDTAPDKQSTYVTNLQTDVLGVKFIDNNQNMLYSLNSQEGSTERNARAYVLIKRDNGDYDWFRLNLLPASTIYYEDNKTATLAGTESYGDWTQHGSYEGKYQSLSGSSDVFGNDPALSNNTDNFSLGTHLETTVSSNNNRSETKTFSFIGTGFDLISACGSNTGIQTVVIKDANGNLKKVYMVDTYYNDTTYGTIYQAPIVHYEDVYGEYTVETTAAYYSFAGGLSHGQVSTNSVDGTEVVSTHAVADTFSTDELFAQIGMDELIGQEVELVWMDENSVFNGGTGVEGSTLSTQAGETTVTSLVNYIDGFRIYNPLEEQYCNAYYPATEKGASYHNLISNLGSGALSGENFIAYVEGGAQGFGFADYASITGNGPKNEVYLDSTADSGFSFKIKVNMTDLNNVRPFLSMRAVSGNPTVIINGIEYKPPKNETYYDILAPFFAEGAVVEAPANGSTVGTYLLTVKLKNPSANDLVALGTLRLTNAELIPLSTEDISQVAMLMTMASAPADYDTGYSYSAPPTYSQAPADNPAIDPEGSLPTIEEYAAANGNSDNDAENKYSAIIEMIKSFFERLIAFFKNAIQSLPINWLFNI